MVIIDDKNKILIKTSQGEMSLEYLCEKECKKINSLLQQIEDEFNTSMNNHPELRHEILDIGGFVKRIPSMISEVIHYESS